MSHPSLASAASPKARLNFLLDEPAPRAARGTAASARLPDRGPARDAVRALSADAVLGAPGPPSVNREWVPAPRDWTPGARAHSADSLSSGASDVGPRSDSSDGGSLSGASAASPALRPLPAPTLLPAAHLMQSSGYGGVFQQYVHAPPPQQLGAPPTQHLAPGPAVAPVPPPPALLGPSPPGPSTTGSRRAAKTEAQMRERHDQRKMKNRISAAASRDRKKRSFTNLQRMLQDSELKYAEAKRVIETLTLQLEQARNKLSAGESGAAAVPVPHDLRDLVGGKEFVPPQVLLDVLRAITRR